MKLQAELIFIWKVLHLDSFWNRGTRDLGNGLLDRWKKYANHKTRLEHLTDIEMRREKRWTDDDRKRAERKQQEYNDIDSCHPLE